MSNIESVLHEHRRFDPPADCHGTPWHVAGLDAYKAEHARSIRDPEGWWAAQASTLDFFTPWTSVLEWNLPDARWFVGATTNVCHN